MEGADDQLRIPLKFIDGKWQYAYGGPVPVRAGAFAELIIHEGAIDDQKFLSKLRRQSVHRILGEGVSLLVSLAVRSEPLLPLELRRQLIPAAPLRSMIAGEIFADRRMDLTGFVKITVGPLAPTQEPIGDSPNGGIWLILEGTRPKRIKCSQIFVPDIVSKKPLGSLNQALTRLSEFYEPWRISHTGSIYSRIYHSGADGRWHPLETLRQAAIANIERSLAVELGLETKTTSAPAAKK